jgi:hypothetical protein
MMTNRYGHVVGIAEEILKVVLKTNYTNQLSNLFLTLRIRNFY